ncbi:alpha/beta hydrolase [Occultella kanbiaonis]|uniref:alpha/beta hydrolase n=1 Tax=Occultella kanbiaonis TaxID=2675754 RepID=UPI00143D7032|nr:alpha/beta hydrolase [Occultella kanbiaonis]
MSQVLPPVEVRLQGTPGRGFVLVLPGGGYTSLSPAEAEPVCAWLTAAGIPNGLLRYSVDPARHPEPLVQVLDAVHRLREQVDGPIAVMGFSAGGHLAGLAATATASERQLRESWGPGGVTRPDLAVLAYPVTAFHRRPMRSMAASLLGSDPAPEDLAAMSLESRVDATTPPFFIWHTSTDPSVPADDSVQLAQALLAGSRPVALHLFASGGHALGVADGVEASAWKSLCLRWLEHHGL